MLPTPESPASREARLASVLPMALVDDANNIVEELVCESISGGAQYVNGMPRRLSLARYKDGERIEWAEYEQVDKPLVPVQTSSEPDAGERNR